MVQTQWPVFLSETEINNDVFPLAVITQALNTEVYLATGPGERQNSTQRYTMSNSPPLSFTILPHLWFYLKAHGAISAVKMILFHLMAQFIWGETQNNVHIFPYCIIPMWRNIRLTARWRFTISVYMAFVKVSCGYCHLIHSWCCPILGNY